MSTTEKRLVELEQCVEDLCNTTSQLAMVRAQELRAKLTGYLESEGSDSARRRYGDIKAMEASCTALELEADVFCLAERKWLLQRLLDAEHR